MDRTRTCERGSESFRRSTETAAVSSARKVDSATASLPTVPPVKAEPGRYHLYVAHGCPWAHRTLIYRALKKLDGLISVVYSTIDEGRSVEATLEAVGMPHYGDYSLFEWAHNSVNVPAAYQHLRDLRGGEA